MKNLWKRLKASPAGRREEGIALVVALLILVMLTVVGLVAIISSSTETAIAVNAKGSTQALYLAEAGVAQVAWWFKSPATFTLSAGINTAYHSGVTAAQFFTPREQLGGSYFSTGGVSQFKGSSYTDFDFRQDASPVYDGDTAATNLDNIFTNLLDYGHITELRIFSPTPLSGNICRVRVTASSKLGGSRTIEQDLGPNSFAGTRAPLQSGLGAAWNGNGTIHWGDVLVMGNANLQNNLNQVPYQYKNAELKGTNYDRWFNAKISGTYAGQGAGSDAPYATTCNNNPDGAAYNQICHDNLLQRQAVTIDKWDYSTMKQVAIDMGSYYVYSGGNVHEGGPGGPVRNLDTLMTQNNGFVFVDTPNQMDPAAGGTSFTLNQSGNPGGVISGAFYVAGNLEFGGLGSGSSTDAVAPPNPPCTADASGPCGGSGKNTGENVRDTTSLSVNIKGVLYSTGMMSFQGSPVVFGAVVAEGGFGSGGTPDIYYDWDVRSGRIGDLNPTTKKIWHEVRKED